MPLPIHQQGSYFDLCDLWSVSDPDPAANSLPADPTYTLAQSGVSCRFVVKSGVDALQTVGLVESDDLVTVDELRLPENTTIESGWIAVNKTLLSDGSQGPYYGKAWIVRGEPRRRISTTGVPAGRVVAYVSKLPTNGVPSGVS